MRKVKWTLVQHSGWARLRNREFKKWIEIRRVASRDFDKIREAGGLLFGRAENASDYIRRKMRRRKQFAPEIGRAGEFSRKRFEGRAIFVPDRGRR